jgi:hypothetical protein
MLWMGIARGFRAGALRCSGRISLHVDTRVKMEAATTKILDLVWYECEMLF